MKGGAKVFLIQISFLALFLETFSAIAIYVGKKRGYNYFSRKIESKKYHQIRNNFFKKLYKESSTLDYQLKKIALINGWINLPLGKFMDKKNNAYYTNLENGERKNPYIPNLDTKKMTISSYGSSFVRGDEVSDNQTIQYHLGKKLNTRVQNFGASGYSPLQALIKFSMNKKDKSDVVIMGITTNMINRNGYLARQNYLIGSSLPTFSPGLKSIAKTKKYELILPNKIDETTNFLNSKKDDITTIETYLTNRENWYLRNKGLDLFSDKNTYKGHSRFPFSYNFIKGLLARNCIYLQSNQRFCDGNLGWTNNILKSKLTKVLNCFENLALKKGKLPIIMFMPRNLDIESPRYQDFIMDYKTQNSESILIDTSINVSNIKEFHNTHGGHPSNYGYKHIAEVVANKLSKLEREDIISIKDKRQKTSISAKESFCSSVYNLGK